MTTVVVTVAVLAPWVSPYEPSQQHRQDRLLPPSWLEGGDERFVLGTDQLGRDVLSRLLHGSRISVVVGLAAMLVSGILGVSLGLAAGLLGGRVDALVSRSIDTFLALPFFVLVLAVIGVLGPGLVTIILVLGVTGWSTYARVVRGETISLRSREFVGAASALGASRLRLAVKHVLPNTAASIIVLATLDVATTILAEASLSFLGLGVQPPSVTWGLMISSGREYIATAWWLTVFPGACISFTVLGVMFLGDFLRDVLDPKIQV